VDECCSFTFLLFLLIWFFQLETDYIKSVKNTKPTQSNVPKTPINADSSFRKSNVKIESFNETVAKKTLLKIVSKSASEQKPTQQKTAIVNLKNIETNQQRKRNNTVFSDVKLNSVNRTNSKTQVLSLIQTDSVNQNITKLIDSVKNPISKSNIKKDVVKTVSVKKNYTKTI